LSSFVKYNTYPIKKVILCEDSGIQNIADFAGSILPYDLTLCYNETRIGQMKTIEKYTPLIETPYVFHLEDDYEFFDSGFIELSLKILQSDPKISQVLLEDMQHRYHHDLSYVHPLCNRILTNNPQQHNANNGDGALYCFSWRPSLKKTEMQRLRMPYEVWDDEYTIQLSINKLGLYSVVTKNTKDGQLGFCTHIGTEHHVPDTFGRVRILGRKDFPDKINIRLNDIF